MPFQDNSQQVYILILVLHQVDHDGNSLTSHEYADEPEASEHRSIRWPGALCLSDLAPAAGIDWAFK